MNLLPLMTQYVQLLFKKMATTKALLSNNDNPFTVSRSINCFTGCCSQLKTRLIASSRNGVSLTAYDRRPLCPLLI